MHIYANKIHKKIGCEFDEEWGEVYGRIWREEREEEMFYLN